MLRHAYFYTKGGKEPFAASARWPYKNAKADTHVSFTREFSVPYKKVADRYFLED
jgi:hypothetical protein